MHEDKASAVNAHRVSVFSDAVIAVIMTVMVLELKAPVPTLPSKLLSRFQHCVPDRLDETL